MERCCTKCEQTKPAGEFYAHRKMRDGLLGTCKACVKASVTHRRRTNPAVQEYDRKRGSRQSSDYIRRYREQYPEKYAAHTAVGNAVRDGRLKKEPCLFCGCEKVEGHHRDYSKPLDVVWLCAKCHKRLHAVFPETSKHEQAA